MALTDTIAQAQKMGASSNDILGAISKQNPNTPMAQSISKAMQAGANPDDVLKEISRQNASSSSAPPAPDSSIIGSEVGFGHSIGDAISSGMATDVVAKNTANHSQAIQHLSDKIKEMNAAGQDSSSVQAVMQKMMADNPAQYGGDVSKIIPSINKTSQQIIGEAGGVATDLLTAGGALSPTVAGAAFGLTHALQQDKGVGGTLVDTAIGAIGGKILQYGFGKLSPFIEKAVSTYGQPLLDKLAQYIPASATSNLQSLAEKATIGSGTGGTDLLNKIPSAPGDLASAVKNKVVGTPAEVAQNKADAALNKSVQDTMPLQDKQTRTAQMENGQATRKGVMGKVVATPTAQDVQVGAAAHPFITGQKDPVMQINSLVNGVKDVSAKTDAFLNENPTQAHMSDIQTYVEKNNVPNATLKNNPGAMEQYKITTANAMDTLNSTLKASANKTGEFTGPLSGADIRAARIKIDQQIKDELGATTFGTPQYAGIKAAAVDSRNVLNRMNEDLLRYPGQLDALNKYNQAISDFTEKGIKINPEIEQGLKDHYGLKSTPAGEANAQKLAEGHKLMENLYTARDNMVAKNQSMMGKNWVQNWIKNNPGKAKAIGYTLGAVGTAGIADAIYLHLTQ